MIIDKATQEFYDSARASTRRVKRKVLVDWDKDNTFTDESERLKLIEFARVTQEPLGGIQLAQMDVIFENTDDRFTPGNTASDINEYLTRGRPIEGQIGFGDDFITLFKGKTETPNIVRKNRECRIHSFDELQFIGEKELTGGGELFIDIRTDRYIWGILDYVYSGKFNVLASCDSSESWWYGYSAVNATASFDTTNQRYGDACRKLEVEDGVAWTYNFLDGRDLTPYTHVSLYIYAEDVSKLKALHIELGSLGATDIFVSTMKTTEWSLLSNGWNEFNIPLDDFQIVGSPDWSDIDFFVFVVETEPGETTYAMVDVVRASNENEYPRRVFDIGLQYIPTAWWGGNKALSEIKTACEAEGARFYSDEYGVLRFENRQHYNVNPIYKKSVYWFPFDRTFDFVHPNREQDIINSIKVTIKPRVVGSEEEIWRYPFVTSIGGGGKKTIWASLVDPCPTTTTGIVQPVATTDYTANTQSDGSGTDKTAQIDVAITRFTNSVKIDITNNDPGTVYITLLKLRGTPAKELDPVIVSVKDDTSIEQYGERPAGGLAINNKYLADETYAETLAQGIIDIYKNPIDRITLKVRAMPQLQIGDMITIINEDTGINYLMRIYSIETKLSLAEGLNQEIKCRSVLGVETLTLFEIGTSEIEGDHIIAP